MGFRSSNNISRIVLSPSESKWPFVLKRDNFQYQFSLLCQLIKARVNLVNVLAFFWISRSLVMDNFMLPSPELQVEMALGFLLEKKDFGEHFHTKNVVYKEIFNNLLIGNTKLVLNCI